MGRGPAGPSAARPGDDERRTDRVLVHILLATQAVTAYGQPLIAGKDDDRAVRLAGLLEADRMRPTWASRSVITA